MKRRFLKNRKALSAVITEVILVASTLTIGVIVWAFASGYTNLEGSGYFQKVSQSVYGLKERFMLEQIAFNFTDVSSGNLLVWVFNYGSINIEAKVTVLRNGTIVSETSSYANISTGNMACFVLNLNQVSSGNEFVVKVESQRGNVDFDSYKIC